MTCIEQGKIHLPSNGFAIAGKIAVHSLTIIVALTIVFFLWQEHGAFTLISLVLAIYLIPAIVACCRKHRNRLAIVIANIFLGWTFLGWVGSLVWACTNNVEGRPMQPGF
jgi:hypothetical protein